MEGVGRGGKVGLWAAIILCLVGIAVLGASGVVGLLLLAIAAAIGTFVVLRG